MGKERTHGTLLPVDYWLLIDSGEGIHYLKLYPTGITTRLQCINPNAWPQRKPWITSAGHKTREKCETGICREKSGCVCGGGDRNGKEIREGGSERNASLLHTHMKLSKNKINEKRPLDIFYHRNLWKHKKLNKFEWLFFCNERSWLHFTHRYPQVVTATTLPVTNVLFHCFHLAYSNIQSSFNSGSQFVPQLSEATLFCSTWPLNMAHRTYH